MNIVIPDDHPPVMAASAAFQKLLERATVGYYDTLPGSEERLIERIQDADIVINIRSSCRFTSSVIERTPKLRLLSIWGTGTDNVDLTAAAGRGVTVTNTPGVAASAIGEHCLALALAVARRLVRLDGEVRRGAWPKGQALQLAGKTLGIIGLGAIGREFARLGAAVGMRVIAWTMHPNPALGVELVQLDELYRSADVISLHLRLSPETVGFIGKEQFARMKSGAIFINTARGAIVDERALVEVLKTNHLAGAGLDVYSVEPLPAGHPLKALPNVVLTPHSGGITPEVLEAGLSMAVDNVFAFLDGKPVHVVIAPPR